MRHWVHRSYDTVFLGHSNSWEEVVRKLHLSGTPQKKVAGFEIWRPRWPELKWHLLDRNSFKKCQKRQETWRFRLHFPAGRNSTPLVSECSTFPEWNSTSTIDRLHGEWRLGTSVLATRSPDRTPCDFFLWDFVKDAVYVPPLPTNLNDLRNPYHSCGEISDARHPSSSLGWIQLPSRCYPCRQRRAYWTSVNCHVCIIK